MCIKSQAPGWKHVYIILNTFISRTAAGSEAQPPPEFAERLEMPLEKVKLYQQGKKPLSAELFIKLDKKIRVNLNWSASGSLFYCRMR